MKQTLFTTILILTITASWGQQLPELIREYQEDCNQIVQDTIEQKGVVSYNYIPVKDNDGKVMHYALGEADTTWKEPDCPDYKYPKYDGIIYYSSGPTLKLYNHIDTLGWSGPLSETTVQEKHIVDITRQYVCSCKQREVEPFSDHFWKWLLSHK